MTKIKIKNESVIYKTKFKSNLNYFNYFKLKISQF